MEHWVYYLTTPNDDDVYIGASDETFRDSDYLDDNANDFRSAAYAAEISSFLKTENPNILEHDRALYEIDALFSEEDDEAEGNCLFEEGFNALKITNADDFMKLMEAMDREAAEGGGASWVSPDLDMKEIEKIFERQEEAGPCWMEFIDDLRNGRYGDLPEDYDGLADPEKDATSD